MWIWQTWPSTPAMWVRSSPAEIRSDLHSAICCILRKKPYFDAAFGVATITKQGESASGDSHSVIKIDERRFMVSLSDGMGSGEYAKRISESTISLLESFYRAKMPSELILSTINKLLTFGKEESFYINKFQNSTNLVSLEEAAKLIEEERNRDESEYMDKEDSGRTARQYICEVLGGSSKKNAPLPEIAFSKT